MADVWVLGSAAWDLTYRVDRMPPAGGLATARFLGRRPGGSTANVARALASAGHQVHLVGRVGADRTGADLVAELETWGVDTAHVDRQADLTPETLVFVDGGAERTIVVLDKGPAGPVPVPYAELRGADLVYVGWYGDFGPELPAVLPGLPALVATQVPAPGPAGGWYAHLVVGSAGEYPRPWLAAPYEHARRRPGPQLRWAVVTRGPAGATGYGPAGEVPVPAVGAEPVDTTGAGDSFTAGLLHGLLRGDDLATAGRLGARWAATTVTLPQSTPARWDQVDPGSR